LTKDQFSLFQEIDKYNLEALEHFLRQHQRKVLISHIFEMIEYYQ
jgi:hypothetical protein